MEGRLGDDPAMSERLVSIASGWKTLSLAVLAALVFNTPVFAGDYYGARPLRYGNTSSWSFDARNDDRDFPNNGFFPGNFAANPWQASIGAAGFLESNPYRSPWRYPSEVYFRPAGDQGVCARRVKDRGGYHCARSAH
jgi:hypothetical protein